MAYQVFITDGIDVVELDTENIDLKSVFSLLDITNIGARKDNIKTITFKGTKINNNAFGTFFDFGRTSDFDIVNNLLFNYNPLKAVTAFVYEDSSLIFKGSLRLTEIAIDANSQVVYSTIVTGSFIDLKTAIQDKYLTDLDFSDMQHLYNIGNITSSWTGATGIGYVYPNIDYGYYTTGYTTTVNDIDARNFKPAVYVKEYMNRIFQQDGLSGFTYEIKGSPEFKEMFNSLIVPDSQLGMQYFKDGYINTYSASTYETNNVNVAGLSESYEAKVSKLLAISAITANGELVADLENPYSNVLTVKRTITTSISIDVAVQFQNTGLLNMDTTYRLLLAKRQYESGNSPYSTGWEILGETAYTLAPYNSASTNLNVTVNNLTLSKNEQVGVILTFGNRYGYVSTGSDIIGNQWFFGGLFTATTRTLKFPANTNKIILDVVPSRYSGDSIQPVAPVNCKQIEFLKSIVSQFNFVVYTNNDNHKHLMFERYDDFYSLTLPQYIKNNSLDWTNKIDYKNGFRTKSNIQLPKSYLFTYKTDVDYLTDTYKNKFAEVYGQLAFDDTYGLTETKKVELIFSPTINTSESGTDRKYPLLYKVESNQKKPTKTNIRLAHYNGLQPCNPYTIYNDETTGGITSHETYFTGATYPQASNYYLVSGSSVADLNFGLPLEYYFAATSDYTSSPTSYSNYYINQVSDLTNPNVTYFECNVLLDAIDIANLDLRVPVYINTGWMNGAYFKVLKVEYDGSDSTSKVMLQKIGF